MQPDFFLEVNRHSLVLEQRRKEKNLQQKEWENCTVDCQSLNAEPRAHRSLSEKGLGEVISVVSVIVLNVSRKEGNKIHQKRPFVQFTVPILSSPLQCVFIAAIKKAHCHISMEVVLFG